MPSVLASFRPPRDVGCIEKRKHLSAPLRRCGHDLGRWDLTSGSGAPDDVEELHGVQMDPGGGRRRHVTTDIPDEPLGRCLIVEDHGVVRADAVR